MEQRRYFLAFLGIYTLDLHVADKAATLAEKLLSANRKLPKEKSKKSTETILRSRAINPIKIAPSPKESRLSTFPCTYAGQFRSTLYQNQSIATNTIQYKIVLRSGSIEKLNAKSRRRKYQGIMPSSDSCESAISRRESTEKRHVPADLSVENKRRCILITLSNDTRIDASPARSRFFLLSIDDVRIKDWASVYGALALCGSVTVQLKGDHTCVTLTTNNGGWNGGRKGVDAEKSTSINGPDTCKAPPADQSEAAAAATRACSDRASDSCHAVLIATEMALLVDESKTILSFYKIATIASPQCIGCRNVRVNGPIMPRLQNNFTMGPVSEGSPSPSDEKTQHTHLAQYCKSKRRVCADRISFHPKLGVLLRAGLCPRDPRPPGKIAHWKFEFRNCFGNYRTN